MVPEKHPNANPIDEFMMHRQGWNHRHQRMVRGELKPAASEEHGNIQKWQDLRRVPAFPRNIEKSSHRCFQAAMSPIQTADQWLVPITMLIMVCRGMTCGDFNELWLSLVATLASALF